MDRMESTNPAIKIEGLDFWYRDNKALSNINLDIYERRITAIIGPSGCGKSTLLFCLNRMFDEVEGTKVQGSIKIGRQNILSKGVNLIELRRQVGIIFQKPTVFPLSIKENVSYGLRTAGLSDDDQIDRIVIESLKSAAIYEELKDRLDEPAENLSGGQQQRLCIARAIAMKPKVLLMDEPCSALDPISTLKIEDLMQSLKTEYTVVVVTHNMQQAARASDITAFMWLGEMVECGDTRKIFTNPTCAQTEDYVKGRTG